MAIRAQQLIANASVALVAGTANVIIIPAPGVGFQARVFGGSLATNRLTAAAIVDVSLSWGATIILRGLGMTLNGTPGYSFLFPEPGITGAGNTALTLGTTSTAATGTVAMVLFYLIDAVS